MMSKLILLYFYSLYYILATPKKTLLPCHKIDAHRVGMTYRY